MTSVTGYIEKEANLEQLAKAILKDIQTEILQGSIAQYQHLSGNSNCKKVEISVTIKEINE